MESLRCDICTTKVNKLNSFSCNHRSCENCYYKVCLKNKKRIDTFDYQINKEIDIECLICSSGKSKTSKRSICQKLIEITETILKDQEKLCSLHSKHLNVYCTECKVQMCSDCFSSHKALPMFTFHQEGKSPDIRSFILNNTCFLHDNIPYHYVCMECSFTLCEICKSTHNKNHKTKFLQEFYNQKKNEFISQFVVPPYTEKEISQLLDQSNALLKEQINKDVIKLKDEISSIIEYLNEVCAKLDTESEFIFEEIDYISIIDKILLKNLMKDLDDIKKSSEFDLNCFYLEKVSKRNSLATTYFENDKIKETLNSIKNYINKYKLEIKDNDLCFHINVNYDQILSTDSINNLYKSNLKNKKTNSLIVKHTLKGNSNCINTLIVLQDGRFASASSDNEVRIYNPQENYKITHTLSGHSNIVFLIVQLKDGRLASVSNTTINSRYRSQDESTIRIWDSQDNFKCTHILPTKDTSISLLIVLKDGKLALGLKDGKISIWDPQDNFKCTQILSEHKGEIGSLIALENGGLLSSSEEEIINIWELD